MSLRKKHSHIPTGLYKRILASVPLIYVDVVIEHKKLFLLLKRSIPPMKGYWLTPGGRLEKGERLEEAARREVEEETGLGVRITDLLGVEEYVQRLPKGGTRHCINFYYKAVLSQRYKKIQNIKLNFEGKEARWFSKIPRLSPPYQTRMLKKAGFK